MIKIPDLHIHCNFSSDSDADPEQMLQRAITLGLPAICFTDHNDYDFPLEDGKQVFLLDFQSYVDRISALKQKYQNMIPIYIGVEQGLQDSVSEKVNAYDPKNQLDFIIGSSHLIHGADPYYKEFWEGRSVQDTIISYYESILENIKSCSNFDIYGHLDYIIRYAPGQDREYNWKQNDDLIETILKSLIEHGKGIEVNTAGLKYGLKEPNPCAEILKRYHELGGEIITIGSDAHTPESLAYEFERIPAMLTDAGFRYYTIFQNRKPVFLSL